MQRLAAFAPKLLPIRLRCGVAVLHLFQMPVTSLPSLRIPDAIDKGKEEGSKSESTEMCSD